MNKSRAIWVAIATALFFNSVAFAQSSTPWLEGRRATSGIGIRTGNLELHPGVAGEVGYDSNFFQAAGFSSDPLESEPVAETLQLRLTPSLALQTIGSQRKLNDGSEAAPPKVSFRSVLSGRVTQLFNVGNELPDDSVNRTVLGADLGADLGILPASPWGADIGLNFSRVEQPTNNPDRLIAFDRNSGSGSFDLRWRPGGGVLRWSLGYSAGLTVFDDSEFGLNSLQHGPRTSGRWRFLPRTSLLFEGSMQFITHTQSNTRQIDSNPITTQLGLNGLLTPRFSLLVMGGWKATFYDADPTGRNEDYDGPVGRAEVTWHITRAERLPEDGASVGASSASFGYARDVRNSGISNFYRSDRLYADATYTVGGVLLMSLRGGVAFVHHPLPLDSQGEPLTLDGEAIDEIRPDARLYLEYRLSDTLAVISRSEFSASPKNNFLRLATDVDDPPLDNLRFLRFTSFLGARWFL